MVASFPFSSKPCITTSACRTMYFLGLFSLCNSHKWVQSSDTAWGREGISIASNPGSLFRILSRSFGDHFSPKLQDKIQNREPGFEDRNSTGIQLNIHNILSRIVLKFPFVATSQLWYHWYRFFFPGNVCLLSFSMLSYHCLLFFSMLSYHCLLYPQTQWCSK